MQFVPALLLTVLLADLASAAAPATDGEVQQIVAEGIRNALDPEGIGAAVAVRIDGRTLFYNFGFADLASKRPITRNSVFNIASLSKIFDVTLLALLVRQGEVTLNDPVAEYIDELRQGGDMRQVTLGQLATFTSGLSLPQDGPPWPAAHYTLPKFLDMLKTATIDNDHQPGKQYVYSHAGFMLLHVALERRFGVPYGALLEQRLLLPAVFPPLHCRCAARTRSPGFRRRSRAAPCKAIEGTANRSANPATWRAITTGREAGKCSPPRVTWPRCLLSISANCRVDPLLREAVALTHREVASVRPGVMQAQAWEVYDDLVPIIDKNGGLSNVTAYIGMIPGKRLGTVILINRGDLDGRHFGQPILQRLALPDGP